MRMSSSTPAHDFARHLARRLTAVAPDAVNGVYLHGSAVLGDWNAKVSDVDVLVVVDDAIDHDTATALADVLAREPGCPGIGLEASIVTTSAAADPAAPW